MSLFVRSFFLIALILAPVSASARRVALVIANSRYVAATALANPASDGRLIAQALKKAGFESVDLQLDLGKTALENQLRAFSTKAEGADVALIYYAGHGIEAGGQNYLIPVDARLQRDRDLEIEATRLETALLMGEGARMRIFVLDACRNNPFTASMQRTMKTRAVGRGLAAVEPEGETLVVYSAKAGATAADGEGANSPFAESLAKRLPQPGLEISLLFRAVRDDVLQKTGRQQEPFTYGSLSGNAFYFVGNGNSPQPVQSNQQVAVQGPSVSREATETLFWQGALTANTEPAFREYLKRYPGGTFAELARQNLGRFAAVAEQPRPKPKPNVSSGSMLGGAASNMPDLAAAFSAPTGQVTAGAGSSAASRFAFVPNQAQRKQTTANFMAQMRQTNQQMGALLELMFTQQDMFALVDKEVAKYGLNTSNLADTLAILVDNMRDAANGRDGNITRVQAQAVRDQMALILIASPDTASLTNAKKQEMSDTMVLTSLIIAFAVEAAKTNGSVSVQEFADVIQSSAKTDLGIDLRAIRLTNEGYRL